MNGKLVAAFFSSPELFDRHVTAKPVVGTKLTTEKFSSLGPYLPTTALGATTTGGAEILRIIFLENTSYWQYDRPRKKARKLPADMILIGTSTLNRECTIKASAEDQYHDYNPYYASTTNIISSTVFDNRVSKDEFQTGLEESALILMTDGSAKTGIKFSNINYERKVPVRSGENVSAGDDCLLPSEHMINTIVAPGGTVYKRRDDVWFCAYGNLTGTAGNSAIEFQWDVRYIALLSSEVCASVLGIPVNRAYLIYRGDDGLGGPVYSRCLGDEEWSKLSELASISTVEN